MGVVIANVAVFTNSEWLDFAFDYPISLRPVTPFRDILPTPGNRETRDGAVHIRKVRDEFSIYYGYDALLKCTL